MTTLTDQEIEELRIAIAEEMGWKKIPLPPSASWGESANGKEWYFAHQLPPYTTSIDAIRGAAMERFKTNLEQCDFQQELDYQFNEEDIFQEFQLTAIDWCIAFSHTAKIWRYKA